MAEQASIRCMQLPLNDFYLLLPNSAVAEIIGYTEPAPGFGGDDWFDGQISWRGVMVPIISFEKLCQKPVNEPGPRSRVAVLYNHVASNREMPYFGIILEDIPRGYLAEQDRMLGGIKKGDCEYMASQADAINEALIIPDLDAVVARLQAKLQD